MRFCFSKGGVKVQGTHCLRGGGGRFALSPNPVMPDESAASVSKITHLLASKPEAKDFASRFSWCVGLGRDRANNCHLP